MVEKGSSYLIKVFPNQKQYEAKWIPETKYTKKDGAGSRAAFEANVVDMMGELGKSKKLSNEALSTIKNLPF